MEKYILKFSEISINDTPLVGGKNSSLGEMFSNLTQKGVAIPDGFALTSEAYWHYLKENKIEDKIRQIVEKSDFSNLDSLNNASRKIRDLILNAEFPKDLKEEIVKSYDELSKKYGEKDLVVAVRSSATAEDLPTASFAGQHESYLNVSGEKDLLRAVKNCLASLFLERAISYREEKGFDHLKIALSVGVQKMVDSSLGSSGIIFTLDTETGFQNVVSINSIWGVGEFIVKGRITPDQFYVFKPALKQGFKAIIIKNLGKKERKYVFKGKKGLEEVGVQKKDQLIFSLTDEEIIKLANWACAVEDYYGSSQDIEWAKDGKTGEIFIVQSRPETVHRNNSRHTLEEYQIKNKPQPILSGIAIGNKIGSGKAKIILNVSKISEFEKGDVLITKMTDPDWMPVMRQASAIVTERGGKTCHAAIVSRELGLPCIVGASDAISVLKTSQVLTIDCSQGSKGFVYEGKIPFELKQYDLSQMPKINTKLMVNVGIPETAFKNSFLPVDGVGLARQEFIIAEKIKIHPLALYNYDKLEVQDSELAKRIIRQINDLTIEHKDKKEYFIKELAEGIGQIASAFWPRPVIVRLSDFKSNEYRRLVGGELFEPLEENPMIGLRGAARYYSELFKPAFEMECQALKRARNEFGLKNIRLMVPFCRTLEEGRKIIDLLAGFGLKQNEEGLEVYVMAEIPSNIILADKFLDIFDGMSIGSNDLTQLVLGLDRDSALIFNIGDERNEAVKEMIARVIDVCKKRGKYVGICGEAPSNFPDFAEFLVKQGIESISVNPDVAIKSILNIAEAERKFSVSN